MSGEERSDIRIVRLAITMFKCPLKYYLYDPRNWEMALRYCGSPTNMESYFHKKFSIDYDNAISLFQVLFDSKSSLFAKVLEYMLNDFVRERARSVSGKHDIRESLTEIENELLSLGYVYDIDQRRLVPVTGSQEQGFPIESELDFMLRKVDENLVLMRHGAWDVFMSQGSDAFRQCMSSARELLRQCLEKMSPGKKTRKERVKDILKSEKDMELVDSLSDVVDRLYASLSKEEHTEPSRECVLFTIRTVENTLYFLLKRAVSSEGRTVS